MQELDLGPNGALVYCLEYLEQNLDWLVLGLQRLGSKYFVIDFPGQVELFTHYSCVHNIAHALQQKYDFRLTGEILEVVQISYPCLLLTHRHTFLPPPISC